MSDDIEKEIERLMMKKVDLVNKINSSRSSDEKEEYNEYLGIIQKQINILEGMKEKRTPRVFSR